MKSNQSAVASGTSAAGAGAAAGLGRSGLGASGGQRLPSAPRERKPALAALAVLLILGGALTSAYLVMASGQRVSAIRIAQPVAAGQRIPLTALEEVQIGDTGVSYIAWSERMRVTQAYAAVPLVKGALLTNAMVSRGNDAARGRVVVGLALKPGQFPAQGLEAGKHVVLYAVGSANGGGPRAGTVLSADAVVLSVGGGAGRLRDDQTTVDVAVAPSDAPQVAQAASAGAVAVGLVPEGTRVGAASPAPEKTKDSAPGAGGTGQNGTQNGVQNGGQDGGQAPDGGQPTGATQGPGTTPNLGGRPAGQQGSSTAGGN
ncbi:hypothetical protein Arub01_40350 [Actinomadura rubrobrunea]|uniref:SAF domain-containing protein n=1 Tax=Actinomadura rubrobrunea TaxID=115335 RepID=A0A9W6UVL6_9ACTN|nr:hypothetical protein [Actinomadura rubrobrunea]GLW65791.1 hypothetical protein Arub01_40350 [Actinomadura rubrobrunea]